MRDFELRERAAKVLTLMADGERRMAELAKTRDEAVRLILNVGADIGRMEARLEVLREEYDELVRVAGSADIRDVVNVVPATKEGNVVPMRVLKLPEGMK